METSRTSIDTMHALAEAASAQAEFTREMPAFMKLLDIAPSLVDKLPIPTLLLLVNMRLFKLLSTKLREIDARTAPPTPPSRTVQ